MVLLIFLDTTQSNIPLLMYLDCVSFRCQQLTTTPSNGIEPPRHPDAHYVMDMMLGSMKKSYEKRVAGIQPGFFAINEGNVIGVARGSCPVTDPSLKGYFNNAEYLYEDVIGPSSDTPTSSSTSFVPTVPFWDLWATKNGSWANHE